MIRVTGVGRDCLEVEASDPEHPGRIQKGLVAARFRLDREGYIQSVQFVGEESGDWSRAKTKPQALHWVLLLNSSRNAPRSGRTAAPFAALQRAWREFDR